MADQAQNGNLYTEDGDQGFESFENQENDPSAGGDETKPDNKDLDDRKVFVGGLSWETSAKDLKDHFGKYGEVSDVNIKSDPATGRSRGFAFILFATKESVDAVLAAGTHNINGKQVDPKRAKAKPGIKKIFVGGLDPELPEADIRAYFEQFGKIEEIELPFDKQKNQRRQFCFITFESEAIVNEICKNAKQTIGSKECDVKRATPKVDPRAAARGGWGGWGWGAGPVARGGRGGRGRGARGGARGGFAPGYYDYSQGYGGYDYGYDYYGGYGYGYPGWDQSYGYGAPYDTREFR